MKKDLKKEQLEKLDIDALKQELNNTRKGLFNLKLSFGSGEVKDYSQFKKLKRDIAQCLTFLKQKEKKMNLDKAK